MILFLFHTLILTFVSAIILFTLLKTERYNLLGPLIGLILLFVLHCLLWGESCTFCDLSNVVCIAELVLFWFFAGWGVFTAFLNIVDTGKKE